MSIEQTDHSARDATPTPHHPGPGGTIPIRHGPGNHRHPARARHAHRHGHRLPQCADDGLPRRARRNPRQRRGLYRECSDQHHHHHIVCHECGRTIEIEIPGLEQWIDKAAKQLKYQTIAHELEIFDLCPKCAAKHAIEPPLSVGTSPKDGPLTTPDDTGRRRSNK